MKFSGFRILKSLKIAFLQIFRIQDPESSGSGDPAGKSQEGRNSNKQINKENNCFLADSLAKVLVRKAIEQKPTAIIFPFVLPLAVSRCRWEKKTQNQTNTQVYFLCD